MVNWVLLMQIHLCLYFPHIRDFLVTFISLEEEITHFFWSLGTDFVINFDLVKCITKININNYPNYNGKVEGGLSPER